MKNRKNGVAVIIVLGLLALLMVLGVAFSVSMRVERAGAANYSSAARTRQMVWAGLARAIGDINQTTTNAYPVGDFLASGGSWGSNNTNSGVRLLTGKARDYVPEVFLDLGYDNQRSLWLPLGVGNDDREGYAAYMVLNLSDMLDANHVGGATREGGWDASELALVTNVLTAVELQRLVDRRTDPDLGPFESLAELKAMDPPDPPVPADYFSVYSRYLVDTNRANAVYMGTNVTEITANRNAILGAMRGMLGAPRAFRQESVWFDYLLDYVDTNTVPRQLNGPNAKPVPLLNEVAPALGRAVPTLSLTGLSGELVVEVWNPSMTSRPGQQYKIIGNMSTVVAVSNDLGTVGSYTYTSSFASEPRNSPFRLPPNQFRIQSFPVFGSTWPSVDVTTNNPQVNINVLVSNLQVIATSGNTVVESAAGVVFRFAFSGAYAAGPVAFTPQSWQAIDPRVNWHQRGWTNAPATITDRAGLPNAGQDGKRVYASEKGVLYSPLELGHLLCLGQETVPRDPNTEWSPWREFQIDGASRHALLENFTTHQSEVRRGLVNANSFDPTLIQLAFEQLPDPVPSASSVAAAAANYLVANNTVNPFRNLSDTLDLSWRTDLAALGLNDVEWDSVLAYSTGLLGVRQNLFLIVVSASAAGQQMGQRVGTQEQVMHRGRQRALAVVWRDPVENPQGLHDCFVQHFQWLD